ncbi:hypothetical protein KFL_000510190 [Klebsormidium nitens]|uniref:Blue (type 1) copper domain-containing protein n=1 Tax=Klebsormidium nitens TaxID=105231 RepID=A0A1Y1HWU6_KLENI|nr:hypothetical protein KFL_000510190 [Klebsormidium nitens]|eukprot:GAQ80318.1 hypothetical protein KFL_000510190 [Klebsormidium nitens]
MAVHQRTFSSMRASSRLLLRAALLLVGALMLTDAAAPDIYPTYIGFTFLLSPAGTPQDFGSTACVAPCSATFLLVDGQPHAVNFPASDLPKIVPVEAETGYLNDVTDGSFAAVVLVFPVPGTYTFADTANPTKIFGTIVVLPPGVPAPAGVNNPNQCYNNVGTEYIFCPGGCGPPTGLASCAGVPEGQTFNPVINAPGNVTFPQWQINAFNNPVNCKAPCTATWIWSDPTPHTVQGFGPNADAPVWTDNDKRLGIEPNDVAQLGFTVSLTFAQPGLYGFICGVHGVSMYGLINVYDGSTVPCLNAAINPNPTYNAAGTSLTCV